MTKKDSKKWTLPLGSLALFLLIWEYGLTAFPTFLFVLPPPSEIFHAIWEMRSRFLFHTSFTIKEMCSGFFIALTCAFPLAWIMMRYQITRSIFQPFFIVIQCIPMFALAPIMVIWFGWGHLAIVIPTALMIFFPLTLTIYQGLRSTPQELLEFFETNQATSWQTLIKLRLPWSLPHIFSGFRISAAIAGVSAVAGEWAGAQNGLGVLMLESRRNTELEVTFGALFCLTLISLTLYLLILFCEKLILRPRKWKFFPPRLKNIPFSNKKRVAFSLFILGVMTTLLIGCHQKDKNGTTRLLLDWLPNPNHIPLYVGVDLGFFKEMDIKLNIQKMKEGGGGISYLVANKTDLLINHMPGTLKACERGAQIKIVGSLIKQPLCGLIYRDLPSIQKPSDLSGLIFGYCIGLPDIEFLNFLLDKGEIVPKERKNVSVDLVASLGTKNVDFIYGGFWNIEPFQLRSKEIETKTFKIEEFGVPAYYEMIVLANANSSFSQPDFVKKFQQALQKSIDYCKLNPEEAFLIYLKYQPDQRTKTNAWQRESWALTVSLLSDNQKVDVQLIERFYHWQLKQNIIKQPFDIRTLITTL